MIASPVRRALVPALLAAAAFVGGCTTPAGAPPRSAFEPGLKSLPPPPDVADQQAAELARAALLSDRNYTARVLHRFENIEKVLAATDEPSTGLMPVAIDLRNTTVDDRRAYRNATRDLLKRKDLAPSLRARLELFRDDDPLALANARIRDAWLLSFGRAFNHLAEPVGKSIMTWQLAPYRLGQSLLQYAVEVYTLESFNLQRRQALAYRKEFLERNPDAPEAEWIEPKVREAQARFLQLQRDRSLRVAHKALDADRVRLALVYADRALRYVPEDREASELRDESARRLLELRDRQQRSVSAGEGDPIGGPPAEVRAVAVALLAPGGDAAAAAAALDPDGPLGDEARYVEATLAGEAGDADAMWATLEELASEDPERSNMARHAATLVSNPQINTWGAYRAARRTERLDRVKWLFLGPFFHGIPDRGLPGPLDWVVEAPSVAQSMAATPMRLINVPWAKQLPSARVAAVTARNHLVHHPDGPHSEEVREWLLSYEQKRQNWMAALEVAEQRPDPDLEELSELREKAARQYLEAALREPSVALRIAMYEKLGSIYPGSRAARVAGDLARQEAEKTTAQNIRLSKGFLLENPEVAGPSGLDLRPELLDGDPTNAELHPNGVTLVGSRVVRVSYLAPSGDEDDPPVDRLEKLDGEDLARLVSQLEETSYRKMLEDPLDSVEPDAKRDRFFERARLGLDELDPRPGAISSYAYRGVRERYGMVRGRESILPFDIVVQGSLGSMSLGAFPRIRAPKETPDAVLFR